MRTRMRYVAACAGAGLLLAACGGGGSTTDDNPTDAATGAPTAGETAVAADPVAFCDALYEAENAPEPEGIDFETATDEEIAEAEAAWFADVFLPRVDAVLEAAPEEVRPAVQQAADAFREHEGFEAFESEEFIEAENEIDAYILENCEGERVDVTAVDYAFEGAPDDLDSGTVLFNFANEGTEEHEMVILRKNDDTTESWDELLQLPEEEGMQKASFVGAMFAPPGEDDAAQIRLEEPGEYLMVCFVPVGSVPGGDAGEGGEGGEPTAEESPAAESTADEAEGGEGGEGEGPPHFTQGMRHEFTVGGGASGDTGASPEATSS